jgi:hypothetical protein
VAIDETPASRVALDLAITGALPSRAWASSTGLGDRTSGRSDRRQRLKVHRAPSRRDDFGEKTAIDTSRGLCAVASDGSR